MNAGNAAVKRSMDLVLGSVLLVLTLPVQAIAAAAVRVTMGSPVIFRQDRGGLGGCTFRVVKLRTMHAPDHSRGLVSDADRLTRLGRFLRATSIDELPTFWNVIRGDMSLVGPRPLPAVYLTRFTPTEARRHEVRPGVTGPAQIAGRNALPWEDRFRLDVAYVDTHTLGGDLVILLRTVLSVVKMSGIAAPGSATMTEFTGTSGGECNS